MFHTIVCAVPFVYGAGNLFSGGLFNVTACLALMAVALIASSSKARNFLYGVTA